jgi:hypothetical protein
MCVIIYSYNNEWETNKNTNFYVVHSLKIKFSIKYKSNTYGGVMLSEKLLLTKPIAIIRICNRWMRAWDR